MNKGMRTMQGMILWLLIFIPVSGVSQDLKDGLDIKQDLQ
jgi:hypothetical protein